MIDATDILPKSIQHEYNGISGVIRVNYGQEIYYRIAPHVIYVSTEEPYTKYQFDKKTWVTCDRYTAYRIEQIDCERVYLSYDREFYKDSVSCAKHYRNWQDFAPFMEECSGYVLPEKHLKFNLKEYLEFKNLKVKVVSCYDYTIPRLKVNGVLCKTNTLQEYSDCFKSSVEDSVSELEECYVRSYSEVESIIDIILEENERLGAADTWSKVYEDIQSGVLTFDSFIEKVCG